jgi:hypothetical protein
MLNMPVLDSEIGAFILSAGYLLGTTLTFHPGVSGFEPPSRKAHISGGVMPSCPSQKGHFSGLVKLTSFST